MTIDLKRVVFAIKTKILVPHLFNSYKNQEKELEAFKKSNSNFKKRQQLVKHAFENSTFYKKKYAKTKTSFLIKDEEDFNGLPVLTRNELLKNFEQIRVKNIRPWQTKKMTSSGSTGSPISVLHDLRFPSAPLRWRILSWWGVKPYENQAFIFRYRQTRLEKLIDYFAWWPTKRVFLPGAEMNLLSVKKFVKEINTIKPALLQGYVDVVYEFALFLLDYDLKISPPKMVWVTSAPLLENQRKLMEKAFGAPVCNQYGSTEIFLMAAECPAQKGLHILMDSVHIEFVDENNRPVQNEESAKILVTDLRNYAFPLIRYEIGDRGSFLENECGCGIHLPLMDKIKGRESSSLKMPSGLILRAEHISLILEKNINKIREIQLVQNEDFSVQVCFVDSPNHSGTDEINKIIRVLKEKSRHEISFNAVPVNEIEVRKNKKPLIISMTYEKSVV